MWQIVLFLYFILLGCLIRSGDIFNIIIGVIFGLVILTIVPVVIQAKKNNIRLILKNIKDIKEPQQIVNVNKVPWYIFEELPGFTRISAKKAVWLRNKNHGYPSVDIFYELNNVEEKDKKILNKIIFV